MIDNFIESMESQKSALASAMTDMANVVVDSNISSSIVGNTGTSSLSGLEQALASRAPAESGTWVFPIYIGNEAVDTIVVDAIDRYNYATGGH